MTATLIRTLTGQFEIAWALTSYHLDGLTTDECLWRPTARGLHVHEEAPGRWVADWPDHEGYDLGPPSIAWTTWHIGFWWSAAIDYAFHDGTLTRQDVLWPGSADGVRTWLTALHDDWSAHLSSLDPESLASSARTRWPFTDRPFADVVAWANLELMKNAAEIGYARFLHGVRAPDRPR